MFRAYYLGPDPKQLQYHTYSYCVHKHPHIIPTLVRRAVTIPRRAPRPIDPKKIEKKCTIDFNMDTTCDASVSTINCIF